MGRWKLASRPLIPRACCSVDYDGGRRKGTVRILRPKSQRCMGLWCLVANQAPCRLSCYKKYRAELHLCDCGFVFFFQDMMRKLKRLLLVAELDHEVGTKHSPTDVRVSRVAWKAGLLPSSGFGPLDCDRLLADYLPKSAHDIPTLFAFIVV